MDNQNFEQPNPGTPSPGQPAKSASKSSRLSARRKKRRRRRAMMISALAVCLAAVIGLTAGLITAVVNLNRKDNIHRAIYNNASELTVAADGDKVSLYDSTLGDIEIPALAGVPVSTYSDSGFSDRDGLRYYYDGGELCSYTGVDVSSHNGEIDWDKVKAAGIDFAMVRIGGRGYGIEGVLYSDDMAQANLNGAKDAGLMVGAYFFSSAITADEARQEAEYSVSLLGDTKLDYPLVYDWEIVESADAPRNANIPPQTLTDCARAFCDTVKQAGFIPTIYTNHRMAYYKYDLSRLSDIDLWYAYYGDTPDMYYNYMMWQYSAIGTVDGISGDADLNICMKNYK